MKKSHGFAMLEVLISLLIIMVGVLGLAGLQLMSINNTEVARYQSLATMLASNMATQIQSNIAYWGTSTAALNITVVGSTVTGGPTSGANCKTSVCTASQMAYYDLQNWGSAMIGTMPSGQGAVVCSATVAKISPAVCTLTITWNEKNIALTNPTGTEAGQFASGTNKQHSYQTMVTVQ
jgi:type IV pilus assembly protein PilV